MRSGFHETNETAAKVSLPRLAAYGCLGLPLAVGTLPVYLFVPTFYAEELGLGFAVVGAVLFLARLFDMVSDPLVGWLSDRTAGRFGRRIPWIAVGLPLTSLGFWLLLRPDTDSTAAYLAMTSILLYAGWTCVIVPYTAWGAEVSPYYHQRSYFAGFREAAVVIGTVVAIGIASTGSTVGEGLGCLATVTVPALAVCGVILIAFAPRPLRVAESKGSWRTIGRWRDGLRLLTDNRPFRRLLVAWFLNGMANGLPATLFLLFVTHRIGAEAQAGLLLLAYFGASIAGLPIWIWLSRRWGKHRTWCGAMIWACSWFALAPFLGQGDIVLYAALCIGTGLALGADLMLPPSMQADVVDVETARTGMARTGLYFALWSIATKLALALTVGLAFPALEWAGGPVEGGAVLAILYGAVPILLKLLAVGLLRGFEIDEEAQESLRVAINDRQVGAR